MFIAQVVNDAVTYEMTSVGISVFPLIRKQEILSTIKYIFDNKYIYQEQQYTRLLAELYFYTYDAGAMLFRKVDASLLTTMLPQDVIYDELLHNVYSFIKGKHSAETYTVLVPPHVVLSEYINENDLYHKGFVADVNPYYIFHIYRLLIYRLVSLMKTHQTILFDYSTRNTIFKLAFVNHRFDLSISTDTGHVHIAINIKDMANIILLGLFKDLYPAEAGWHVYQGTIEALYSGGSNIVLRTRYGSVVSIPVNYFTSLLINQSD